MYKKIVLIMLCFLVAISCSSPSSPNSSNNGNIGNNGDTGNSGETQTPVIPPTLDEETQKYGIDISQDDAEISKQIEEKLQEYYNEKASYKVIFKGVPKNYMLKANSSLAALTINAAEKINADNITIDTKNIDFQNGAITELMFASGGVSKKRLSFIFPDDKIITIEQNAFLNLNNNIEELIIPNSVVSIGERAFQAIYSLKSLTLDSKLQIIGDYAFLYLESLRELIIPDSVISIGKGAFANSSLEKVTISASVKEIKNSAFNTSRKLNTVIYLGTSPNDINYENDAFLYCNNLTTLILPNVPNPDYNTWKNFLGCNFTVVKQK
ncbi:leucine-rich repeat domain-containing protein [Brachyspira sp. SAP_772]|uniref:leucine-rich repeat domain-containing protein n=1 Tax=Brachyspira sp. SAP_772 TaxID=2608385 RepID=UPI0012F49112|nr:leucine-rich repeat domain-containing protein [Brachyspira sp. SAP_772]